MEDFNSKYSGEQVEALLDQVASGNAGGGGGGITVETDPVFSASPAASITDEKMAEWDNKVDAEDINNLKPLITDFSIADISAYVDRGTNFNYNSNSILNALQNKQPIYIPYENDGLEGYYAAYGFADDYIYLDVLFGEFLYYIELDYTSGSGIANIDVRNLDDFATEDDLSSAIETYIADFTMESLREGMINGSHVTCDMQALVNAMNANKVILVRDGADSAYKGVYVLNGYAEDLLYFSIVDTAGNVLYCAGTDYVYVKSFINGQALFYRSWDDKQDQLQSGVNIKTINGESILGSGNIEISGGSGEVGPQGPQGEKGDKGDTGVGVRSVVQTTTSNADGGSNVVTVTLTNGTTSTFTVKNGSKGSQGIQGEQGPKGDKGDTGANGTNGTNGKDGTDGEDGATFTPSVDAAGNLSWSNNKGLANPPTVNIKGPKGDKGDAGEGGGGKEYVKVEVRAGEITFFGNESRPSFEPNKIYYAAETITEAVSIVSVTPPTGDVGEYTLYFDTMTTSTIFLGMLELPSEWMWTNGEIPTLEKGVAYELSVVATKSGNDFIYKAVLTKFKPVE